MFRLLKWGFYGLILFALLGALQQGVSWVGLGAIDQPHLAALANGLNRLTPQSFRPTTADELHYQGLDWEVLTAGQQLAGTDIVFQGIVNQEAIFQFPDGRSPRRVGDPLNYRGPWLRTPQTDFTRIGRIVRLTDTEVFVVSRYTLTIYGATPIPQTVAPIIGPPYTVMLRTGKGRAVSGTTLRYLGRNPDTGAALITGQAGDERAQFQVMSSVNWSGQLRNDLHVRYNLRVLFYTDSYLLLGGTAALLPTS